MLWSKWCDRRGAAILFPGFSPLSLSAGDTVTPFHIGSVSNFRRSPLRVFLRVLVSFSVFALGAITSVQAQTASELQVTPETMTLGVGQKQTIFAAAYDRQGNLISSAKFAFWSSDTLVAKVGPDGTVVGVSPGLAKVEARLQGVAPRSPCSSPVLGEGTKPAGVPPRRARCWLSIQVRWCCCRARPS